MSKILLSSLKDKFMGRPAAILGGGPSLPSDIAKLPKDCLMIAVNYHGFYHAKHIDFMVYNDTPETNPLQLKAVQEHKSIHVSPEPTSDVIFDVDVWTGFLSSNTAAWFALYLGCDPVILCGMDCYQGKIKHCPPSDYYNEMFDQPLDFYTRPWKEEGFHRLPNLDRLRVMSGPLTTLFPAYG